MLSLQYIRIRKDRPAEKCLSSIWNDACTQFQIPVVLIYMSEENAYITVNLKHLQHTAGFKNWHTEFSAPLQELQQLYTGTTKGYWKHNECYYTFDEISKPVAQEMASAIFRSLLEKLSQTTSKATESAI